MDLLKEINEKNRLTVSWSINTLDENFCEDMDNAVSIERRLAAMKQVYDAGIRTVCFISPVLMKKRSSSHSSTNIKTYIKNGKFKHQDNGDSDFTRV